MDFSPAGIRARWEAATRTPAASLPKRPGPATSTRGGLRPPRSGRRRHDPGHAERGGSRRFGGTGQGRWDPSGRREPFFRPPPVMGSASGAGRNGGLERARLTLLGHVADRSRLEAQTQGQAPPPEGVRARLNAPRPSSARRGRRRRAAPSVHRRVRRRPPSRWRITGNVASTSASGASKTSSSCTCSSIRADSPASSSASSMRIMARRMMSAAEPWIGALIACALDEGARCGLPSVDVRDSGTRGRRGSSQSPCSRAARLVSSM